jgi:hypothetical protein
MSSDEIKAKFGGKWKVYKSENFEKLLKDIGKFCLTFLFTFVFTKQKEGKKKKKKKSICVFISFIMLLFGLDNFKQTCINDNFL